jgi:hypothetical protein
MRKRPPAVVFLVSLWLVWGLLVLTGGLVVLILGPPHSGLLAIFMGIIFIVFGLAHIALGIGFFRARSWVLTMGAAVSIVSIIAAIISMLSTGTGAILQIIVSVIILYCLFLPQTRAWVCRE